MTKKKKSKINPMAIITLLIVIGLALTWIFLGKDLFATVLAYVGIIYLIMVLVALSVPDKFKNKNLDL